MSSSSQHPWQLASLMWPLCKSYKTAAAILIWTSVTSTHSMEIKIAFAEKISPFLVFINAPAVLKYAILVMLRSVKMKAAQGRIKWAKLHWQEWNFANHNKASLGSSPLEYQLTHRNKKIINPRSNQLCIYCFFFFFSPLSQHPVKGSPSFTDQPEISGYIYLHT